MKDPVAVVPAAGRGTRLGPVTAMTPKALIPVGGRPVIAGILDAVAAAGISDVVVVTGWMAEQIEQQVPDLTDLDVVFVRQAELDGTATALSVARPLVGDRTLVYSWADLVYPIDTLARLLEADGEAALGVNRVDDPTAGAAVLVDSGRVLSIVEKPPPGSSTTPFNSSGVGLMPPRFWDDLEAVSPSSRGEFELTDAENALLADGVDMRAVEINPVFDIGTPERLAAAEAWLAGHDHG